MNYKLKAEKYKQKYLNLKKYQLIGGGLNLDELLKHGLTKEEIKLLKIIQDDSEDPLTLKQIYILLGKEMHTDGGGGGGNIGQNHLKITDYTLTTQNNNGVEEGYGQYGSQYKTRNNCLFISLKNILQHTKIAPGITVEELRTIGGLSYINNYNNLWDSLNITHALALHRICIYFNIRVSVIASTTSGNKQIIGDSTMEIPMPIYDYFPKEYAEQDITFKYKIPHHTTDPIDVYIAQLGLHFEAVNTINLGDKVEYNINLIGKRSVIDHSIITQEVEQLKGSATQLQHKMAAKASQFVESELAKAIKESIKNAEIAAKLHEASQNKVEHEPEMVAALAESMATLAESTDAQDPGMVAALAESTEDAQDTEQMAAALAESRDAAAFTESTDAEERKQIAAAIAESAEPDKQIANANDDIYEGIKMRPFIQSYYDNLINNNLNENEVQFHNLIELYNDLKLKLKTNNNLIIKEKGIMYNLIGVKSVELIRLDKENESLNSTLTNLLIPSINGFK